MRTQLHHGDKVHSQPAAAAEVGSPATWGGATAGSPLNPLSLRLFLLPVSVLLLRLRLRRRLPPDSLQPLGLLSPRERLPLLKGGSRPSSGEGC